MSSRQEDKAKILAWFGFLLGLSALVSALAFATADVVWWSPLVSNDFRGFLLIMLHLFLMAVGGFGLAYLLHCWVRSD